MYVSNPQHHDYDDGEVIDSGALLEFTVLVLLVTLSFVVLWVGFFGG